VGFSEAVVAVLRALCSQCKGGSVRPYTAAVLVVAAAVERVCPAAAVEPHEQIAEPAAATALALHLAAVTVSHYHRYNLHFTRY
jgi:uncharacterized membrane protein (DUF4010 family)